MRGIGGRGGLAGGRGRRLIIATSVLAVWTCAMPPLARGGDLSQLGVLLAERALADCRRTAEQVALALSSLSSTRPAPPDQLGRAQRELHVRQQCLREEDRLREAEDAVRRSVRR